VHQGRAVESHLLAPGQHEHVRRPGEQLGLGQALLWMGLPTSVCLCACCRCKRDTRAKPCADTGDKAPAWNLHKIRNLHNTGRQASPALDCQANDTWKTGTSRVSSSKSKPAEKWPARKIQSITCTRSKMYKAPQPWL